MGKALVLTGISFADSGLGTVTPSTPTELTALTITPVTAVITGTHTMLVTYTPTTTTQKGVKWSITSGGSYATINESSGLLTVLETATTEQSVTVKVTSSYDSTITATTTVRVRSSVIPVVSIAINEVEKVTSSVKMEVTYNPTDTSQKGVKWSITDGSTYATIDEDSGVLTVSSTASTEQTVTVKAISTYDSSVTATRNVTVQYEQATTEYYDNTEYTLGRSDVNFYPCVSAYVSDMVGKSINRVKVKFGASNTLVLALYTYTFNDSGVPTGVTKESTIGTFSVVEGINTLSLSQTIVLGTNQAIGIESITVKTDGSGLMYSQETVTGAKNGGWAGTTKFDGGPLGFGFGYNNSSN